MRQTRLNFQKLKQEEYLAGLRNDLHKQEEAQQEESQETESIKTTPPSDFPAFPIKLENPDSETSLKERLDEKPDEYDPNHHCRVCNRTYTVRPTYLSHLRKFHRMKLSLAPRALQKQLITKYAGVQPNEDDLDFNCCVCQMAYSTKYNYRRHLRQSHGMTLKPLAVSTINPALEPDLNDPNLYCRVCEKTFNGEHGFHLHAAVVHGMKLEPKGEVPTAENMPDEDDPDQRCMLCDKDFNSRRSYRNHLRIMHGMVLKPSPQILRVKNRDQMPDIFNTENTCTVCHVTLRRHDSFRNHLRLFHVEAYKNLMEYNRTKRQAKPPPPTEDDPNFHCSSCDKTYADRPRYRSHLTHAHKMKLKPLAPKYDPADELPDINDPNFYCSVHQRKFKDKKIYRNHLRMVHRMEITSTRKTPPRPRSHLEPDEKDPNFYCLPCDKFFPERRVFRKHIRSSHRIFLEPIKSGIPVEYELEDTDEEMEIDEPLTLPDPNDPDFYCKLCCKSSINKFAFHAHLQTVHNITIETVVKEEQTDTLLDENNPHFYCSVCDRKLPNKESYRKHLEKTHKMILTPLKKPSKVIVHPNLRPDENDPNFYCCGCEKYYRHKIVFRHHIRKVHKIFLPNLPRIIRKRRGKTNVNNSNASKQKASDLSASKENITDNGAATKAKRTVNAMKKANDRTYSLRNRNTA